MEKNNKEELLEDLGEVELNQNGRPKQAVVLYDLTPEMIEQAREKIEKDNTFLPDKKYEEAKEKCSKVWDSFYSNHKCNFFKDRNYLEREIKQITYFREKHQQENKTYVYLELGCGVGNTLFPLLRQYNFFTYQGCDISAQAIQLIKNQMENHAEYREKLDVRVCDVVKDQIPFETKPDLLSMIFVLSAIVPEKHQEVINKIAKWMKPGSCFFFRDYGRYDFGQVNMSNKGNRKLKDNFYVKHDGVCVYYFQQSQLEKLFQNAGLIKVEGSIHCRLLQNRKTGLKMYRIWVQGRFYKPPIQPFLMERIEKQKTVPEGLKSQKLQANESNQDKLKKQEQQKQGLTKTEKGQKLDPVEPKEPQKDPEAKNQEKREQPQQKQPQG